MSVPNVKHLFHKQIHTRKPVVLYGRQAACGLESFFNVGVGVMKSLCEWSCDHVDLVDYKAVEYKVNGSCVILPPRAIAY